jgi:chorismate mutase
MYTNGHSNGQMKLNGTWQPVMCRGIRGAITAQENTAEEILAATRELLYALIRANDLHPDDIASVYFTTTADLDAIYPALAARQLGWFDVALLCGHEMAVPDGLPRCIRVLIHWNTTRAAKEIIHVYLRDARSLRPDRKDLPPIRPIQLNPMERMQAAMKVLEQAV